MRRRRWWVGASVCGVFLRGREVAVGAIGESWGGESEDRLRYGTFRVGGIERL